MFLEVNEVAVLKDVWDRVKIGDVEAITQLKKDLNKLEVYCHALSTDSPPYDWVTINELIDYKIIIGLTIHTDYFND